MPRGIPLGIQHPVTIYTEASGIRRPGAALRPPPGTQFEEFEDQLTHRRAGYPPGPFLGPSGAPRQLAPVVYLVNPGRASAQKLTPVGFRA